MLFRNSTSRYLLILIILYVSLSRELIAPAEAFAETIKTGIFGLYAFDNWDVAFRTVGDAKFKVVVAGVTSKELLDKAYRSGVRVIINAPLLTKEQVSHEAAWVKYLQTLDQIVKSLKSHPAVYAWYPVDEPDVMNLPPEKLEKLCGLIRTIDNVHPIFTVFSDMGKWNKYLRYFDIVSVEPYLNQTSPSNRDKPEKVVFYLNKIKLDLKRMSLNRRVWVTLGAFGMRPKPFKYKNTYAKPTPDEFLKMVELSIVNGVDGILVYTIAFKGGTNNYDWNLVKDDPKLWHAVEQLPKIVETTH